MVSKHDLAHSEDERALSALMRKAQGGDRVAYTDLLRRVQVLLNPYVKKSMDRSGQDSVGDIVQEILLGIHAKRHTYDPDRYFLPWMYAIARYKVIDYFRLRKNHAQLLSIETPGVWEQLAATNTDVSDNMDAQTLLRTLPSKQKTLLELVKLEGLSVQEASVKTGFSTSDIKVSIHRGLKMLQKKSKEES